MLGANLSDQVEKCGIKLDETSEFLHNACYFMYIDNYFLNG